jgi:hypothetical protein
MTKLATRKSTSTKLTDTQLIVLSRAVQPEDGAATPRLRCPPLARARTACR